MYDPIKFNLACMATMILGWLWTFLVLTLNNRADRLIRKELTLFPNLDYYRFLNYIEWSISKAIEEVQERSSKIQETCSENERKYKEALEAVKRYEAIFKRK